MLTVIKKIKSNFYYTRSISLKRVTSDGAWMVKWQERLPLEQYTLVDSESGKTNAFKLGIHSFLA